MILIFLHSNGSTQTQKKKLSIPLAIYYIHTAKYTSGRVNKRTVHIQRIEECTDERIPCSEAGPAGA
jgi:hypothetical protein